MAVRYGIKIGGAPHTGITRDKGEAMKMTKQHFELIAETLKELRPPGYGTKSDSAVAQWRLSVHAFARALGATNHAFRHAQFTRACGLEEA